MAALNFFSNLPLVDETDSYEVRLLDSFNYWNLVPITLFVKCLSNGTYAYTYSVAGEMSPIDFSDAIRCRLVAKMTASKLV